MESVLAGFSGARRSLFARVRHVDWLLFTAALLIAAAGLVTMDSFTADNYFFEKQLIWVSVAVSAFFGLSLADFRLFRRTWVAVLFFLATIALLVLVLFFGETINGATNRFNLGGFSFQPSDPAKLVLILLLAKYFSRRHVEIAHIRHIFVSGAYAFALFALIFLEPDFGSAIILFSIWLGMVLVSGISKRHLALVAAGGAIVFAGLWLYGFADYQKQRILTFIHPYADIQGTGYNAYQATIAVGSGGLLGKGVGYGTQSKLQFLPEYETDFIFAAFAEEWGFVGVMLLFTLYGIVLWRVTAAARSGETNFEILFGSGVAIMLLAHFVIHVGMNIGVLPVTGTTIPFMSYGGSHLVTEFAALGILTGMRRYARAAHKDDLAREFIGA